VNTRYLEDEDFDEEPRDREISLGATTLLGIFFLVALVCAVFFGFGYSMGRKSSTVAISPASSDTVEASSTTRATGASKPTPGLATDEAPSSAPQADDADSPQVPQAEQAATRSPQPVKPPAAKPAAAKVAATTPEPPPAIKPVVPAPHAAAVAGVSSVVQVAAVSHQEDADVLLNALKRRGYNVAVHHEPQDKLLHVQIGPLATRKDADAMRQRLLADGYNAIVK
jgi:cell division protein FtsN